MSKHRDYHGKGQKDVGRKYDPPHSSITSFIGQLIGGESKSERSDRKAYEAGRKNAKRQKR